MLTAEVFEKTASASGHEVIYAIDGAGNEVAIGLLVNGDFQSEENNGNGEIPVFQVNSVPHNQPINWIAAEEECSSIQVDVGEGIACEKDEAIVKSEKLDEKERSQLIKVYKSKSACNKKLISLKRQLEAVKRKLQLKRKSKKKIPRSKHIAAPVLKRSGKTVKKSLVTDNPYKSSMSVKKMHLTGNSKFINLLTDVTS